MNYYVVIVFDSDVVGDGDDVGVVDCSSVLDNNGMII